MSDIKSASPLTGAAAAAAAAPPPVLEERLNASWALVRDEPAVAERVRPKSTPPMFAVASLVLRQHGLCYAARRLIAAYAQGRSDSKHELDPQREQKRSGDEYWNPPTAIATAVAEACDELCIGERWIPRPVQALIVGYAQSPRCK
jgi:hypothetical protein